MPKIKKEHVLNILITSSAICANEILRIFVKGDFISAVLFGTLSVAMLIAYLKNGDKE
jgi:hypothetical protein